jgi:intracellular sulfur oxidation DsrE/DsrF family protein
VNNPNIDLIKSLKAAGVKLTVCGQSLLARKVAPGQVLEEVDIATSMLTTVTTYQLKGYAFLKF